MSTKLLLSVAALAAAARASALQPLDAFLRGARTSGVDLAEARAEARAATSQARAEATSALGRALPGVSLRGTYTRNEFETRLRLPDGPRVERRVSRAVVEVERTRARPRLGSAAARRRCGRG